MEKLYIALVDTPGIFAGLIRKVIKIDYVHVALSLDENLTDAYSFGRRSPFIPFFSGFEKENKYKINLAFPTAGYKIYRLDCTKKQKEAITKQLKNCHANRMHYHYCILGLFFLLAGKPFYQKNRYTCSSFISRLLEEQNLLTFHKHFSLVTPRDFYEYCEENLSVVFEGKLRELCDSNVIRRAAYET